MSLVFTRLRSGLTLPMKSPEAENYLPSSQELDFCLLVVGRFTVRSADENIFLWELHRLQIHCNIGEKQSSVSEALQHEKTNTERGAHRRESRLWKTDKATQTRSPFQERERTRVTEA